MTTLYLDRKGLELRPDGGALALYEDGKRVSTVPLALLDRVVIRAETSLTSKVLAAITEAGAAVVILSSRQGRKVAIVTGRPHNDARIRLAQYARAQEPAFRLKWARRFVEMKIANEMLFLKRAQEDRPDLRKPVADALATLSPLHARCRNWELGLADTRELLGIEGSAQAAYLRAYMTLFPESLEFRDRNRRPPRDPVNACLSLGYTLLHFEAVRVAHATGCDPMIGFFHKTAFGRESLACDLIEPLRPRLDAWVWQQFRSRALRPEHFRVDNGGCLLDKAGREQFYRQYERVLLPASRTLRRYCRVLVHAPLGDSPELPDLMEEGDGP